VLPLSARLALFSLLTQAFGETIYLRLNLADARHLDLKFFDKLQHMGRDSRDLRP
jgi:hypothetical protein